MNGAMGTRSPGAQAVPPPVLAFGPFRLYAEPPRLCRGEEDVRLGGRALSLLQALVSRSGEILSRAELETQVWPATVVEDSSLRVHIAALRRALGDGVDGARYIANVPGRGYSFVATVSRSGPPAPPPAAAVADRVDRLPATLPRLIGRDAIVEILCDELKKRRLVSIVGHGGIGKTSLALAVAARLRQHYPAGVCFVDLAPLTTPVHVAGTVASALGLPIPSGTVASQLDNWLRPRRLLLVLDNCEHLLDEVTALVERLLRQAPGLVVMTTSREPLDAEGEWVHRILPLEAPPEDALLDSGGVLGFSAVQLLEERAAASLDTFSIDARNAGLAAALCRRLDGVPLAIEFAASRIGLLGLQGVYTQLGDRLRLLGSGRRTVLPRHRTLNALLDWSYDLLAPPQREVLRRCGVFKGGFSRDAAAAVIADAALPAALVHDCLTELVAKSLVRVDLARSAPTYSLLEITRAYSLERLGQDRERQAVHRRHAEFMLVMVKRGAFEWVNPPHRQWFQSHAGHMGNIRAALEWCFGPEGDLALGIELLATDYHPMTLFLGEAEFFMRARQALDAIAGGADAHPIFEVRLANIIRHMASADHRIALAASSGTLALAEQDEDVPSQLEALYHLFADNFKSGNYALADRYARRSEDAALHCGAPERLHAGRLRAMASHYMGDHGAAADHASTLLEDGHRQASLRLSGWISWRLSLQIVMARIAWVRGQGARAMVLAGECVRQGQQEHFPAALSQALCLAALPVALWQGDDAQAGAWLDVLETHLRKHPQAYFASWASHVRQVLALRAAPACLAAGLTGSPDAKLLDHLVSFGAWHHLGAAMARWRRGEVGWNGPELLRIEGELLLRTRDRHAAVKAEETFAQALALAGRQGAQAWALRAANSLAGMYLEQGRGAEARGLLLRWAPRLDAMGSSADAASTRSMLKGMETS